MNKFLTFKEISEKFSDIDLVGGKAKSLATLYFENFPVPDGFVITTDFFSIFLKENKPLEFSKLDIEIINRYINQCDILGPMVVRSSASVEDSNRQSYAGQFDSFLNVKKDNVLEAIKRCWYSMYSSRVQKYKQNDDIKMAVIIQKMIKPEVSGVAFSKHPVSGDQDLITIEAVNGSNELLVQGVVTPDLYIVKRNFEIFDKKISKQDEMHEQKMTDRQICDIARLTINVKILFGIDVDIEWAIEEGKVYILQSRPITSFQ
jgi:phosphoenolpyruvate synthase/pyruvate phosphate dikinase